MSASKGQSTQIFCQDCRSQLEEPDSLYFKLPTCQCLERISYSNCYFYSRCIHCSAEKFRRKKASNKEQFNYRLRKVYFLFPYLVDALVLIKRMVEDLELEITRADYSTSVDRSCHIEIWNLQVSWN